jgi:two-component system sensor histidine kinase HydH
MQRNLKNKPFWTGVPPWVLIGAAAVLLPIVVVFTISNINREKELSTRLLLEKGAALIRSFEAGTRTGMMGMRMGMHPGGFKLQTLLTETAQQPDIVYLAVTDMNGLVVAHNDLQLVGANYDYDLDLKQSIETETPQWRELNYPDGTMIFEIYKKFSPIGPPRGRMPENMMGHRKKPEHWKKFQNIDSPPRAIFVGLDMSSVTEAQKADIRHAVFMGVILLLVGFAGIILLFMVQSYRATRASLTRIKAFSDTVVENVPIGLVALDSSRNIVALNQTAESILQLSISDVLYKSGDKVLPRPLMDQIRTPDIKTRAIENEIDCPVTSQRTVPLEVGASMLEDENGAFLGYVLLLKDLTEVRALRDEIVRNQRLASVGRLAAGVAHEIRNPLSSIKGFATYFKERYRAVPEDLQTAEIMIQEVDRLNRVITQLLEFARPVSITPQQISLKNLMQDSLKLIEQQARAKNITVRDNHSAPFDSFQTDPDRMNQVLLNLYLNAIEAMDKKGVLTVSVLGHEGSESIEITVSDTGRGIKTEDVASIFYPYFTTKSAGTGLGLAISHNIIEAMGGDIKVNSEVNKGTTFTIMLPSLIPQTG